MNGCLIESVKEERGGLIKKRSALEIERCSVLSKTESAQFLPFDMKEKIRWNYNQKLSGINEQIADVEKHLKVLRKAEKS